MHKLKIISGNQCVQILTKNFGFVVIRQKGSHIVLKKENSSGSVGTVVPAHKELKIGTLKGILQLAKISEEEFANYL